MRDRPIVHLFCNAHIDPVWMWSWEEGLREAISTFRTAVNLLEEFPEFVFNHNESLLYEWVEEYDPPLFARIQHYVREGRWNITGGWYLQPDLNLSGGETIVRIILEGRRYFAEKFGVRPTVSYNFDTFGHPNSVPQLLKQSGFEMYVHCRPVASQMALPGPFYRWRSADGSEVFTVRPDTGWYGTPWPGQAQKQALEGVRIARETGMDTIVTWGLGDHGGGATRHDLQEFRKILEEYRDSDVEIRHSTPEAFLARIQPRISEFPVVEGELQRTLSGTYTSVATIKRQMREGEMLLASAERWAALAWWKFGLAYPAEKLREAWKRLMFNTFHDVLCGSLVESAMPGVDDMYGYAHDVARRVILKSQNALIPNISPTEGTIPLYVLNPHAAAIKAPIGVNVLSAYAPPQVKPEWTLYDDSGARVPSQSIGGDSIHLDEGTWQPFVGFVADMPPMSVRRYELRTETPQSAPRISVNESAHELTLDSPHWVARFDRYQAALVSLVQKSTGRELLRGPLRFWAMQDHAHAWGGENNWVYNRPFSPFNALTPSEVGDFVGMEGHTGPALRVIAHGDAWVTVECLVGWQHSRASMQYVFYADLPYVDLKTRLYMQARRKMIKLQMPFALDECKVRAEVPYSIADIPTDATEYPYARWVRLESGGYAVSVANNGQYGLDVTDDGVLNLSLTRGGTHISWSETDVPTEKSFTFMDQTQLDTRFRISAGVLDDPFAAQAVTDALELNQPLERFFAYYPASLPADAPQAVAPMLTVSASNVALVALKKAETEDVLILRFQEITGQPTHTEITLIQAGAVHVDFSPHQIRSFKVTRDGRWTACNLLEEAL